MNIKHKFASVAVAGALTLSLGGCASMQNNPDTATGAGIGAAAGAVIGHATGRGNTLIGGIIGAIAGGLIGHHFDEQQKAFEAALAKERAQHEVQVQRVRNNLLKLTFSDEAMFALNSSHITKAFRPTVDQLAGVMRKYTKTHITIVGYTDSTGTKRYNLALSRRRAEAVAEQLINDGVQPARLTVEGRGEADPRATNATAAGRQLNRRVEMLVQPS